MAGDITALAFMQARMPLIDYRGSDANDQKHSQDRTVALVKRWKALNEELRASRRGTLECCEATPGKGSAAILSIVDKGRFDGLQEAIKAHTEQINAMETAIEALDKIITDNSLSPGFWDELKRRMASSGSSIYTQKNNISKLVSFYTQQNPRMPPEDVLKIPEFAEKRAAAERIIEQDRAYLDKMKPLVAEIEGILSSVGC